MGCGGSKQDVATGNLATTRRTLNSEPGKTETTTTSSLSPSTAVVDPAENATSTKAVSTEAEEEANKDNVVEPSSPSGPSPAAAAAAAVEVKTEEGEIVVSKESSPDRYFSPSKEEALAAKRRMGSDGAYYSPRGEPEASVKVDGETGADAPAAVAKEKVVVVKAEEGDVAEGGQGIAPAGKEEELKSKDPADLKEDVLVEEKESKASTVENKNVGEGEKRNNNS